MATKITNVAELFHRFHSCEMQLKQGKIAACLIAFKEVIDKMSSIPVTEKEKTELNQGVELFLRNLAAHKKFQEIFGNMSFGDTDLQTNLEFIKSMIVAQEEEIIDRLKKDEEAAEAMRLEIDQKEQARREEILKDIAEAVQLIDQNNLSAAMEIVNKDEEIRLGVVNHYNDEGIKMREEKALAGAVENYNKALNLAGKDEHLHYNIARAYFEEGDTQKAEEYLDKALKINPAFSEGKEFYNYVLKLNCPSCVIDDKPSGGFLQRLRALVKRLIPVRSEAHTQGV